MKITKYYGNIWKWKCSNNEIWPHVKFLFAFEFNTSSKTMFLLCLNMYAEYTKYWQVFDLKWLSFNHCQECICEHVFSYKRYETTQDFQSGAQKFLTIFIRCINQWSFTKRRYSLWIIDSIETTRYFWDFYLSNLKYGGMI